MSSTKEMDTPGKIIVTGVPKTDTFTEADLEKEFSPFGRITQVNLVFDNRTQRPRGFGFVTYENPKDALDAVQMMEGKDLGGIKPLHCEQATIGRKQQEKTEETFKGNRGKEGAPGGRGRGDRGRGGGGTTRGRGGNNRGRGADFRGRGGRNPLLGGGEGLGRGGYPGGLLDRGRGERRPEYPGENYGPGDYMHDMHGPPYGGHDMAGRKTLLPPPGMMDGRRDGPPPPLSYRGPSRFEGGEEYYEEGPPRDNGGGYRERNEKGYYDDYDRYYEGEEGYDDYGSGRGRRGPQPSRGGMEPSRRGGMESSRRGGMEQPRRGGMEPPRRGGMEPPRRGGMERSRRGGMDGPMRAGAEPERRGLMDHPQGAAGAHRAAIRDYPEEERMASRRLENSNGRYASARPDEEDWNAPPSSQEPWPVKRRHPDSYGYPEEDRGQKGADYFERGYREEAPATPQGRAPGGRPSGRGGLAEPAAQRRRPLLGEDPYGGEPERDYYGRPPPPAAAAAAAAAAAPREFGTEGYEEEDGYSNPNYRRRPQAGMQRQPPAHPDDRYGDRAPSGPAARGRGAGARRMPPGERSRFEEEGYLEEAGPGPARREGYREDRRPPLLDRGYEYDNPERQRPFEDKPPHGLDNMMSLRRQYDNLMDRSAGGPPAMKRERFDNYY